MTTTINSAQILSIFLIPIALLILVQCNNSKKNSRGLSPITETFKFHPEDPFKSTMVPSQSFDIDGKKDNIIEGKNGTVIVCPKGCFKNSKGEIVEENITIELSEALRMEEMLLSNLTTTSNGKPLETDGMIYFNATSNKEQLTINIANPVHVEIPTDKKKPGMMAYKGIRDENGNMNWIEPKELDKFLIPVDINLLDFLPEGFQSEVDNGMPFRSYKQSTKVLTDSLYYSLSGSDGREFTTVPLENVPNEGKSILEALETDSPAPDSVTDSSSVVFEDVCGIDPATIKVIRSEKYQNTLIATKEFETRLALIYKTCQNSVLEIYINNLDKNLFELDKMAALAVEGTPYSKDFDDFSRQGLTNVKEAGKYALLLKEYYEKQLKKVKAELRASKEKAIKETKEKKEEAQKEKNNYLELLIKREKYRMETYGFTMTETGWVNIDNGTLPKDWGPQTLAITIENGNEFDRVYTYVVYTSIKSLYRLNTTDNVEFHVGNEQDKEMLMPDKKLAVVFAIGYKAENVSLAVKEFQTGSEPKINLFLFNSTIDRVKIETNRYEKYARENQISTDLEYMDRFYKEEQQQKVLQKEKEFMKKLWEVAFSCCKKEIDGKKLFLASCTPCHFQDHRKLVGPGLALATKKYSTEWLYKWTTNSQALIKSGDKQALKIYEEYNKSVQTTFNLTPEEVSAIYKYIDEYNKDLR